VLPKNCPKYCTKEGDLVLIESEAEKQRAEAAEEELARLKALLAKQGVDLDT
jgi:hypothetical protein